MGAALTGVLAASCSTTPPVPLSHARESRESLAAAVLDAVESGDVATLDGLALSEDEFREHVWPALPAARPERNLPMEYVWGELKQKSVASLRRTLAQHRGSGYTLLTVHYDGDSTRYDDYTVHRRTTLTVRDGAGVERELTLFGSTFVKDGRYKVFSYATE